jgi:hypothetical protein
VQLRFCFVLILIVMCFASGAVGNDQGRRPGNPHEAPSIQLAPPVPLDGIPAYDVQEAIEVLGARPGIVWAITQFAEAGATEIVFDEIPQTADHIEGIIGARFEGANARLHVQINGDTGETNYNTSAWQFAANGASGAILGSGVGVGQIVLGIVSSESQYTFTISDYSTDYRKKDLSAHGFAVNGFGAGNIMSILSGGVRTGSYDPVRSLRFYLSNGPEGFRALTKITLYGLSDGP